MSDRVNATGPEKAKHSVLQELEPLVLEYLPLQLMVFGLTPCGEHFLDITLANKAQPGLADLLDSLLAAFRPTGNPCDESEPD
jgi:hypothetical protein